MPQVDNTKLSNDFNDIAKSLPNNALSNDNKDHTGIDQLKNSLQQKGYITQDGPTDEYGRRDSLYINGVLYRVNDSQGNWKLVSNANGDAWGGGGAGGAGSLNGQAGSSFGDISSMFTSGRDPRSNDLYNMLMSRASQSLALDPKDPIIANQVNAFGAQQTRGARDYIDQLAESEGPDANLGAERRLSSEHAAQATGSLQASLMQNELTARRGEITQALQEMGTLLTADQQLALQKELGEINAMLASGQLGLDSQNWANRWNWLNSTGTPPGI
jgi:hypothetical protein